MTSLAGGKPPGAALITPGATAATRQRYAEMLALCGTPYWMPGVTERYDAAVPNLQVGTDGEGQPIYSPTVPPTGRKPAAEFFQITGRYPAVVQYEYVDPLQPAASDGVTGAVMHETMRQDMIAFARLGGRIGIQDHWGNPNVSNMAVRMDAAALTGYNGTNHIPLVLTGGAKETDLLAYLDRLAAFFNGLVNPDTGELIPCEYRPMHEPNSQSFWYAGPDRRADYITLWRKVVDYLRTTKGCTNVLYVLALNANKGSAADPSGYTNNATYAYSTWYPGDTYVDVVGLDVYNDGPVVPADQFRITGASTMSSWDAALTIAGAASKAVALTEIGFLQAGADRPDIWAEVGQQIEGSLSFCCAAGFWRPPWGPALGQASNDSLRRMAASRYCLTLDKLPPV